MASSLFGDEEPEVDAEVDTDVEAEADTEVEAEIEPEVPSDEVEKSTAKVF